MKHNCHTGFGIICGLEISVTEKCTVKISKGSGVTSSGACIHFEATEFVCYEKYGKSVVGLSEEGGIFYQLLEKRDNQEPPLSAQAIDEEAFIKDKVVLLYMEAGEGREAEKLVVLTIDTTKLLEILKKNKQFDEHCLPLKQNEADDVDLSSYGEKDLLTGHQLFQKTNRLALLSPIRLMRFGFANTAKECNEAEIKFQIEPADFDGYFKEYQTIIEDGIKQLDDKVKLLHTYFEDLFTSRQIDYVKLFFDYLKTQRWEAFKDDANKKFYVQYFAHFVNDICQTYNELIAAIKAYEAYCCPDRSLFPNHLLLGEGGAPVAFGPSIFRTRFYQPPIFNDDYNRGEKIRFLHWRMAMLIKCFYLPNVESEDIANYHYMQIKKPENISTDGEIIAATLRFTPSLGHCEKLSSRTIPYYYFTADDPNSIHHYWSYEAVQNNATQLLLSYHSRGEESYTEYCEVKQPLAYDMRCLPFYRIEGYIGEAIAEVDKEWSAVYEKERLYFKQEDENLESLISNLNNPAYYGLEDIGGVNKGNRFVLIKHDGKYIADFCLPCCKTTTVINEIEEHEHYIDECIINVSSYCPKSLEELPRLSIVLKVSGDVTQELKWKENKLTLSKDNVWVELELKHDDYYIEEKKLLLSSNNSPYSIIVYPYIAIKRDTSRGNQIFWLQDTQGQEIDELIFIGRETAKKIKFPKSDIKIIDENGDIVQELSSEKLCEQREITIRTRGRERDDLTRMKEVGLVKAEMLLERNVTSFTTIIEMPEEELKILMKELKIPETITAIDWKNQAIELNKNLDA